MTDAARELELLRELWELRKIRRNWLGAGRPWPPGNLRHEDQILSDLDTLRTTKGDPT